MTKKVKRSDLKPFLEKNGFPFVVTEAYLTQLWGQVGDEVMGKEICATALIYVTLPGLNYYNEDERHAITDIYTAWKAQHPDFPDFGDFLDLGTAGNFFFFPNFSMKFDEVYVKLGLSVNNNPCF